jgi:hypothetical protein
MKEPLKITYEFIRFFVISIPVFLFTCIFLICWIIVKQIYKKVKGLLFKPSPKV